MGFYPAVGCTKAARAAFVATYGLINIGAGSLPGGGIGRGLGRLGMDLTTT